MENNKKKFTIIGAGPSGLACAYTLSQDGREIKIFEKSTSIGGLAKTLKHGDCMYDIGPHRFFTLNKEIEKFYLKILSKDAIEVKRFTRILFKGELFSYPLTPFSTIIKLGFLDSIKILKDYFISIYNKKILGKKPHNFEDWIILNFGRELYRKFFKTYTEKVWGIDCKNISKDWAAQRIKNLSFLNAIFSPIIKKFKKKKVKTLVDQFWYPKYGAGSFYEKIKKNIESDKVKFFLENSLEKIYHENFNITSIKVKNSDGTNNQVSDFYFFSCPFTEVLEKMEPKPPMDIVNACNKLNYRNHISVKLEVHGDLFNDNWIYIHDPNLRMARVANYINFSKEMSPNGKVNPITVEYFCFENDEIWNSNDEELIKLAENEMRIAKLFTNEDVVKKGFVERSRKAYPIIEMGYDEEVDKIRNYLSKFQNFNVIGRSGMFKYNNQDHAMATGIYAAKNIILGTNTDIWKINSDGLYQEGDRKL